MSVTKTGWIIAAATAAAFAAGCGGQGHGDNMAASCAGEPAMVATHGCKNSAECKQAKAKVVKHHHKKMVKETTTTKETTEDASKDAAKEEGDAAK